MKLSEDIKSISYLKANAAEIIRHMAHDPKTIVITQNGEAKAVLQDIHTYEQTQESLALLKMLAQSQNSLKQGHVKTISQVFSELRSTAPESVETCETSFL